MIHLRDTLTILTEGSEKIGFGHLRRSVTLARKIAQCVDVRLHVLAVRTDHGLTEAAIQHFKGIRWSIGEFPCPHESKLWILDLEQPAALEAMRHLKKCSGLSVALDWSNPEFLPSATINLVDHGGGMQDAYAAIGRSNYYRAGALYAIIRDEIRALRSTLVLAPEVRDILLTFGGSDPARRAIDALQLLQPRITPEMTVTVILGPLASASYEYELRSCSDSQRIKFLRNPDSFDSILANADLILCGGGGTLLEAMCLGKPTVVLPQNDAEHNHAQMYVDCGACVFTRELSHVLNDSSLRRNISLNARHCVDGAGAERITQVCLDVLRDQKTT